MKRINSDNYIKIFSRWGIASMVSTIIGALTTVPSQMGLLGRFNDLTFWIGFSLMVIGGFSVMIESSFIIATINKFRQRSDDDKENR